MDHEAVERVKAAMLATETDVTMWHDEPLTELATAAVEALLAYQQECSEQAKAFVDKLWPSKG